MTKKLFKQNPIKSFRQWRKAMKELGPDDYVRAKKNGHFWACIGLVLGGSVMIYRGIWYFAIFIAALFWLQAIEYKREKQKLEGYKKMQREVEAIDALNKL